jgi:two-component system, OmpR family, sensor histidine kinase CiaH
MVRSRGLAGLFARIRWRLVGWSMLTLGLILILLGTAVYVAAARSLLTEFDNTLLARSDQFGPSLFGPPGARRGPEGYRGGVFFLAIAADGTVIANPQQVTIDSLPVPQGRAPEFKTVTINDEPTRLLLRRMPDGGLLITGQSLQEEQEALHQLLIVLVAGGVVGLLLSLAGAWFLSGRALVPIQQAFQRQQEFVADASHELRTPLTVLRSATDLMNQHRDDPIEANGELFDDVRAEIARMERLAQDLLTLARSDAGELELMTAPIDLADVAADVVRRTTPLAQTNGVQLGLHAQEGTTVDVDPDRLQQVALILIDNAIKHTPSGGRVDVRVRRTAATAGVLEVIDTGSGISAEHLPRIFDRFYRGDKARVRAQGGTGLGLAIARTLVEAHRGQLSLTSQLGVGTHVTVSLPLAEVGGSVTLGERLTELAAHLPHAASRH